jgi:thiol:disulfide interchange protein
MSRTRLGLAAAIAAVALTAGCASSGTTAAQAPATTAASSTAVATATATGSPTPAVTSTALALPDGYDPTRDANADIAAAVSTAAKEHREVLLDFGADWCPDCQALDVMYRSAQVEPLLQKDYVVVAVDVGRFNHNLAVAGRYVDLRTSGIPALVVLKPDGTVRTATNDGSFSNARTMDPGQVSAFLTRWAPAAAE